MKKLILTLAVGLFAVSAFGGEWSDWEKSQFKPGTGPEYEVWSRSRAYPVDPPPWDREAKSPLTPVKEIEVEVQNRSDTTLMIYVNVPAGGIQRDNSVIKPQETQMFLFSTHSTETGNYWLEIRKAKFTEQ